MTIITDHQSRQQLQIRHFMKHTKVYQNEHFKIEHFVPTNHHH